MSCHLIACVFLYLYLYLYLYLSHLYLHLYCVCICRVVWLMAFTTIYLQIYEILTRGPRKQNDNGGDDDSVKKS